MNQHTSTSATAGLDPADQRSDDLPGYLDRLAGDLREAGQDATPDDLQLAATHIRELQERLADPPLAGRRIVIVARDGDTGRAWRDRLEAAGADHVVALTPIMDHSPSVADLLANARRMSPNIIVEVQPS